MVAQNLPLQEPLASEVNTALIEFGRLSQHAGSATLETLSMLAIDLLKRLVTLCAAQRGALLLISNLSDSLLITSQVPAVTNHGAPGQQLSLSSIKLVRTLALDAISEEEIQALLSAFPAAEPTSLDARNTSDMSCWITHRLCDFKMDQPVQGLLVLGWTGLEDSTCASAMERAHTLLPVVADAAAGVLVSILLAEKAHKLEIAAEEKAQHQLDRLKTELLGTMNHELRNPLATIKGYAATLLRHERRLSREERHEFLSAINQASDRLEILIERLLEMSQLEAGELKMRRSSVDLVHLAGEAITAIEERLANSLPGRFTFKLLVEQANGMPARDLPLVWADPRRLREVLDNLLENAMKYSPKGGTIKVVLRPATTVKAREGEARLIVPPGEASFTSLVPSPSGFDVQKNLPDDQPLSPGSQKMVEVSICDNGIGIPAEHLGRIFDRFHRVDTRLTRQMDGLGLGLAICKRIVDLHEGRIWAESSPGEGSSIHVLLPVDRTGEADK